MNIEGKTAQRSIQADLGSGYSTYAQVDGPWYSVNLDNSGTIVDVRWPATTRERDLIVSILTRRIKHSILTGQKECECERWTLDSNNRCVNCGKQH